MQKNSDTYDIFLIYDHRDIASARSVTENFRSHGLSVFFDGDTLVIDQRNEDRVWEAMAESKALVALLPEDVGSSWMAFELGAAKAWNKPTYAIATSPLIYGVPTSLANVRLFSLEQIDDVIRSIANSAEPIVENDAKYLREAYAKIGLPVDQLLMQPAQLALLVKQFNQNTGRSLSGEQIMSHLLRLRKKGGLQGIVKRQPRQ